MNMYMLIVAFMGGYILARLDAHFLQKKEGKIKKELHSTMSLLNEIKEKQETLEKITNIESNKVDNK